MRPLDRGRAAFVLVTLLTCSQGACEDNRGARADAREDAANSNVWPVPHRLEPVLSIDGQFGHLVDLAVDSRGRIYAAAGLAQNIRIFSAAGDSLTTLGGKGEGPGEFTGLHALAIGRDTLFAFDGSLERITAFSLNGGDPKLAYSFNPRLFTS